VLSTISIGSAFLATVLTSIHFIISTAAISVGFVKICANGVGSFFKSVAVIQLNAPTFFSCITLDVVSAFFLAVAPGVHLCDAASEAKHWDEILRERSALDNHFLRFSCFTLIDITSAILLSLAAIAVLGTTHTTAADTITNPAAAASTISIANSVTIAFSWPTVPPLTAAVVRISTEAFSCLT
jgi:hypothetical protein